MGTQISHNRRKCPDRERCSYQQHSSENVFGRQRGEKGMDTRGSSAWWTRTWSRVEQHQTVCPSQMGDQQGAGVHGGDVVKGRATPNSVSEPDGWSTRCWCPWRGSCEGIDGWDGSGVFTHIVLHIHLRAQLHKGVDERQAPTARRPPQQRVLVLQTHTTHTHT